VPRRLERAPDQPVGKRTAGKASADQPNKSAPDERPKAEHLPPAALHHHIEGRVRLRIRSRRGDAPHFRRIAEKLTHPRQSRGLIG
jgi:hypothetical protein